MKSRLKFTSVLLLFAMVFSVVPALAVPSGASAAVCYQAQFVADITVPDGTRYNPDTAFKKIWKLKNIGTCNWNTNDVMFLESGSPMGALASVAIPSTVAPGSTVEIPVDMKAPSAAGRYIGYWKFKSSQGTIFGIGVNANKAWWVEINVVGSSGEPGGSIVYDFVASAKDATWSSGAGGLTFPFTDGDAKGFALIKDKPKFESGVEASKPGLLFVPQNITNGFIQAEFPTYKVDPGDYFQATVGCESGATTCYVAYRLDYKVGNVIKTFWTFRERFEGLTYNANIRLAPLSGQDVKFILYISAYGSPADDRALWGSPMITRKGIVPPPVTGTPPTATPTKTPGPITPTVPPSACDKAQFIADVTIKDGTVMQPGAQFIKTWDIKNVGSCTWKKDTYQLVYFSGEQMGGQSPQVFKEDVPVGKTVRVSVNLTAPSAAGTYRGYWMFKNASGALFGIGVQANKPWWVDIKVTGPTVTPGGPTLTPTVTVTPGGPTVTPVAGSAYDFAANACNATWTSGAGQLTCPGTDGDAKGFVLKVTNPKLESGATDTRQGILTFPQNIQNGFIRGTFPAFPIKSGDRFRSVISCEGGATSCYVEFRFEYQIGSDPVKSFRIPFREKYEGSFYTVDVDLSSLAGKDVKFILTVNAYGPATGDRALWVGPHIYRAGGSSALPDLTITSLRVELQNPGCMLPDDRFGLRISVANNGRAPAGAFVVKSGDLQQNVSGLAAGETKTVFLPNYVSSVGNSITATADSGNAIAESNEQNNVFSGVVPVPTQPLPCTATPAPTTNTYQNTKYHFKFTLPAGATIVSQSDNAGKVNLPFASGTNLTEKYVEVSARDNVSPCLSPVMDGASASTENVTINNIQFTKQTGQGIALGNIYDWVAYSTLRETSCISLTFILHSTNPAAQPTPPPAYDKNAESAVFTTVMNSFNWIP
jgi:hypothetical protein